MASKTTAVLADAEFNKKWDQEVMYQNVKKLSDPRFGEINIVKNTNNNEILFVKEKMSTSKNEASNDIKELKSRIALNHPNIQELKNYSTAIKKELCSTNYLSKGFYEFPRTDLQKEQNERKRNLEGFSNSELTHFLYQILGGLAHLHSNKVTHGDIRPQTLGYNRGNGEVKILDRLADPSPLEKIQGSNIINKKELFICPELYKKLNGKDKTLQYSAVKNDLYATGLTIMSLGNQDSHQDIYKPNGEFNQQRLDEHLITFDQKYGGENPFLVTVVRNLLSKNESERPDTEALKQNMISYEEYKQLESKGVHNFGFVKNSNNQQTNTTITTITQQTNNIAPNEIKAQASTPVIINKSDLPSVTTTTTNTYFLDDKNKTPIESKNTFYENQPSFTNQYQVQDKYISYTPIQTNNYNNTQNEPIKSYIQSSPINYVQSSTQYVKSEPTTYYQSGQTTQYVQSEPKTTYIPAVQNTYIQSEPKRSYVQSEPTTTYIPAVQNTYIQSEPKRSYVQSEPTTTYVQSVQNTHYIQSEPKRSYINSEPTTTYIQSEPKTTYVQSVQTPIYSYNNNDNFNQSYIKYTPSNTYSIPDQETKYVNNNLKSSYKIQNQIPLSYTQTTPIESQIERKSYSNIPNTSKIVKRSYIDGKLVDEQISYDNIEKPTISNQIVRKSYTNNTDKYSSNTYINTNNNYEDSANYNNHSVTSPTYTGEVKVFIMDENGNKIPQDPSKYAHLINKKSDNFINQTQTYSNYKDERTYTPVDYIPEKRNEYSSENKIIKKKYIIEGDCVKEVNVDENGNEECFDKY